MTERYTIAVNCNLREDVPEVAVDVIRYLTDSTFDLKEEPVIHSPIVPAWPNLWDFIGEHRFLVSNPEHEVISNFRIEHYKLPSKSGEAEYLVRYNLQFALRHLRDDYFFNYLVPFVYWLATLVPDDVIGYYNVAYETDAATMLIVKNGAIVQQLATPGEQVFKIMTVERITETTWVIRGHSWKEIHEADLFYVLVPDVNPPQFLSCYIHAIKSFDIAFPENIKNPTMELTVTCNSGEVPAAATCLLKF